MYVQAAFVKSFDTGEPKSALLSDQTLANAPPRHQARQLFVRMIVDSITLSFVSNTANTRQREALHLFRHFDTQRPEGRSKRTPGHVGHADE